MIAQIDEQLGRILDYLDSQGTRDDTVVIFTSDHGEALGDHGLMFKGCRFYEGLVRVPLILQCPSRMQAGLQSEALVELTDLAATLIDLAGLEPPEYMQGKTLVPLLHGQTDASQHRDSVRSGIQSAANTLMRWIPILQEARERLRPCTEIVDTSFRCTTIMILVNSSIWKKTPGSITICGIAPRTNKSRTI